MGKDVDIELTAITFHIKCKCGAEWDLTKQCKRQP